MQPILQLTYISIYLIKKVDKFYYVIINIMNYEVEKKSLLKSQLELDEVESNAPDSNR